MQEPTIQPGGSNRRRFIKQGLLAGGLLAAAGQAPAAVGRQPDTGTGRRIAFISDIHARPDESVQRALDQAAAALVAAQPDVILTGGDHIHGGFSMPAGSGTDHWATLEAFFERIDTGLDRPVVWMPMAGNHDLVGAGPADPAGRDEEPRAAVRAVLGRWGLPPTTRVGGRLYYRRDLPAERGRPATRILVLDTVEVLLDRSGYRGRIDPPQLAWIGEQLNDWPVDQPLIVLTHLPLRSTYTQVAEGPTAGLGPNLVVTNSRELDRLLEPFRHCRVLQGHLHVDETITWNSRTYRMGGAVCGAWWKGANFGTPPGFLVLEQASDGSLAGSYRGYG